MSSVARRRRPGPADETGPVCGHPWCRKPLVIPATGRPPIYCSERCRKHAHALKRQDEARVAAEAAAREAETRHQAALRELATDLIELRYRNGPTGDIVLEWLRNDELGGRPGDHEAAARSLMRFVRSRESRPAGDERRRR